MDISQIFQFEFYLITTWMILFEKPVIIINMLIFFVHGFLQNTKQFLGLVHSKLQKLLGS